MHNPASGVHGGVIADGGIRRDATVGLAALRHIYAGKDEDRTLKLRRYILGLSLVAFTTEPESYLRQGCMLVRDPDGPYEFVMVYPDGRREPVNLTHRDAFEFAKSAAKAFEVGESRIVPFDKERAKRDVKGDEGAKSKARKKASK